MLLPALSFALAFAIFSRSSPLGRCSYESPMVQLPTGRYIGLHDNASSTTTYYAIPYAHAERFKPSKPIVSKPDISLDDVVDATNHGAACINFNLPPPYDKGFGFLLGTTPIEPQSENCLSLDVYVPDGGNKDLPVLFFTPGGGFLVGASFAYDMKALVSRGAALGMPFIGVSINYRLGPLGFLNPSTWGENINLGLLDQVEALRYVKNHIVAFGGSPEKVTISGQSAGGESTMHQFLWTDEELFRSVWIMSTPTSTAPYISPDSAFKNDLVRDYAKACGCSSEDVSDAVECLGTAPVNTLTNNSIAWQGSMTSLGGSFVKRNIFDTIRAGNFPRVPVMVSTCRDEGTVSALGFHSNDTETTSLVIEGFISGRGLQGEKADQFLQEMLEAYPNDPILGCPFSGEDTNYGERSQYKRMAAIATDGTYTEGWIEIVKTLSSKTETWGLYWEQAFPGAPPALGVTHGSDLTYYFPSLLGHDLSPSSVGSKDLMHAVQDALINFIHYGDPNGRLWDPKGRPYYWPPYGSTGRITVMNADFIAKAASPPRRPGFDVLHKYLRPGPF